MKILIDYNDSPDFDDSRVTLQDPETYDELDFQKFIGKKLLILNIMNGVNYSLQ